MPIKVKTKAKNKSTIVFEITFTDEDDQEVAPNTLLWSLYDDDENIVNERTEVEIATPEATEDIVLFGDDLDYSVGSIRNLLVMATYDSSRGEDLPLNDVIRFDIEKLVGLQSD